MDGSDPRQPLRSDLPPSAVIGGKYRLDAKLAEGGMGTVWVATNLVLESRVAIKVLHREHVHSETAEARLLREARAAAQIGHQNIVQVFDFGKTDSGFPFIVMELLKGEDLGERIDRIGRIPALEAVRLMLPVVSAVAAAHAMGIVHRDLKPQNIFLAVDASGVEIPKVVDFGVAKMHVRQHVPKLTLEGRVVGSPEYLSPEQARGQDDIDARADVWALGATLFEMIAGELPFADENYNRLLRKIIEDEPVSLAARGLSDEELSGIVRRALAKPRADRWQSAAQLGEALLTWLDRQGAGRASGVWFSQPDLSVSAPGLVMNPVAPPSALSNAVTAVEGAPAQLPGHRDDRLGRTSPDRVRRAASSRLAIVLLVAGVLAISGIVVVGISLMSAAAQRGTEAAAGSTSAAAPEPPTSQVAVAPSPVSSPVASDDGIEATAPDPSETAAAPPTRTSTPKPGDNRPPTSKTKGAKPPPIPTEPNF